MLAIDTIGGVGNILLHVHVWSVHGEELVTEQVAIENRQQAPITKQLQLALIVQNHFKFLYCTGTRRSEALGLQWHDLHIDNLNEYGDWTPYVIIARGRQRLEKKYGKEEIIREPKWNSNRKIFLDINDDGLSETASMLLEYREKQRALWITLGKVLQLDDYVFTDEMGRPFLPDTVSQAWRKVADKCGFKGVHLHNLRHSHATTLVDLDVDAETVRDRLGHANVATTLGT